MSPPPYDQEVYTLYRGTAECEDEENVYWHSWTDSYDSALGFALKYNTHFKYKDAKAYRINVRKRDILFYTDANHEREFFISTTDELGNKSISPRVYIELGDDPLTDQFEKHKSFHFDFIPLPLQKSAKLYIENKDYHGLLNFFLRGNLDSQVLMNIITANMTILQKNNVYEEYIVAVFSLFNIKKEE